MKPAAVILDFDGVVVNSLTAHLNAWQAAVAEVFRRPLPDPEELTGHATRTIAQILARRYGHPSLAGPLAAVKERLVGERAHEMPLLPGAREIVAALANSGMPFGIASNSTRAFVTAALKGTALSVEVVLTAEDVRRGKPEPDLFWACADRLGVLVADRRRVVVFEDSAHGLHAAKAAGMVPVGVATEQSERTLLRAGAVAVCASLADALARGLIQALPQGAAEVDPAAASSDSSQ